jgi:hypothetical protein
MIIIFFLQNHIRNLVQLQSALILYLYGYTITSKMVNLSQCF